MSVTPEEVGQIARLAELSVDEEHLDDLAAQMSRIVDYIAQLSQVSGGENLKPFIPGPDAIRLRADVVAPQPLEGKLSDFAPAFREGFFLVPKLGAFEGAEEEDE
ncbi:MAG TPA: Asp-tRNA(Asn)/Glu-tRNA(Gln) amidotransferase subunit GatC [Gemmatimonadales bacterium]|nr:Asp-tRNA(Asn)/Glu-tRNA(Gln) amidotransferase subunit GatC [Gemmatimonadales bacterium]